MSDASALLTKLLPKQSDADAFSANTLMYHKALQDESLKDHQWHREQVQRRERAKYLGGCTPESWCPTECEVPCPTECEDDVAGVNFVNSSFIGDDAMRKLAALVKEETPVTGDPVDPDPQPQQPVVVQQPIPAWVRTLLTLLAVLLGAILILIAYSLFGGGADTPAYELIAEPFPAPTGI